MKTAPFNTIVFSSAFMLATTSGQQIRGGSKTLDPATALLPPFMNSDRRRGLGREIQEVEQHSGQDVWWDPAANAGVVENEQAAVEDKIEAYATAVEEEVEDEMKEYTAKLVAGAADETVVANEITNVSGPVEGQVAPTGQQPPAEPNAQDAPANPTPEAAAGGAPAEWANPTPEAAAGGAAAEPVKATPEAAAGDAAAEPAIATPEAAAGDAPVEEPVQATPEASSADAAEETDAAAGDAAAEPVQAAPETSSADAAEETEENIETPEADAGYAPVEEPETSSADAAEKAPKGDATADAVEDAPEAEGKKASKGNDMAAAKEAERGKRPAPQGGLSHVFEEVPEAPELGLDVPSEALPVAEEARGGMNRAKKTQGGSIADGQVAAKEGGMTGARNKNQADGTASAESAGPRGGAMASEGAVNAGPRGGAMAPDGTASAESAGPRGGAMASEGAVNAQSIDAALGDGMRTRRMMIGGGGGGDNARNRKLMIEDYLNGQVKSRGQNRPYYYGSN